jgi:hypothetical protein
VGLIGLGPDQLRDLAEDLGSAAACGRRTYETLGSGTGKVDPLRQHRRGQQTRTWHQIRLIEAD